MNMMAGALVRTLAGIAAAALVAGAAAAQDRKKIRIGWQPTSIISAQIAHAMMKTDIAERNGLIVEHIMFTLGPPLNEGLVSNAIDAGYVGDMPAISMTAAGAPTLIVGRQTTFRTALLSSTRTDIKKPEDLRGKKIYGPYGTSAYLSTQGILQEAKVTPGKDVEMLNLAFGEIVESLNASRIDNFYMWEPWVTFFEKKNLARVVGQDPGILLVILMREDFYRSNPDVTERLLKANKEALLFCAHNQSTCNKWVLEAPQARAFDESILQAAASLDPQWNAKSLKDIRVSISSEEMKRFVEVGKRAFELKILQRDPPLQQRTDLKIAEKVDAATWDFDPKTVKITAK
jgi:sulfonate transport system substrate-binding protein